MRQSTRLRCGCGTVCWWGQWRQDAQGLALNIKLDMTRPQKRTGINWSRNKSQQEWRKDKLVEWWGHDNQVYNILPSPNNLFSWGLKDTPACLLHQNRGSLEHILSCCHNQVLRAITGTISTGVSFSKHQQPAERTILFVKAGEKPSGSRNSAESSRQVVLLELTVPLDDWMEEASEQKRVKYEELAGEYRNSRWKTGCLPIKVGCRGFAGQS
ncbi:Nonribosomal peptide synthase nlsA [Labeo rohita]|uniref:Nonribosomal peptide synthase nlsA n=1 Tax=Labeo rohita TaxID=84645 RepID=A0ABQ8MJV0_LABRO|nr:Nonribosomal peptide synthase nlsA [Labeo rohita]